MTTFTQQTDLIKRTTIHEMCKAWRESKTQLQLAFDAMNEARERLLTVFGEKHYGFRFGVCRDYHNQSKYENVDALMKDLKRDAWRCLIDRMELRRVMSLARSNELDKQLSTGDGLPEIEESQLMAMIEQTFNSIPQLIEELVKEVFEFLRPPGSRLKTNSEFEVGRKVIIPYGVSTNFRGGYSPQHYRRQNIKGIDNVFHALDGKGSIDSLSGPFIIAIEASKDGHGETDYFKFKCFKNGNLHMEFKRLDLVAKLNATAGGMRLRRPTT